MLRAILLNKKNFTDTYSLQFNLITDRSFKPTDPRALRGLPVWPMSKPKFQSTLYRGEIENLNFQPLLIT